MRERKETGSPMVEPLESRRLLTGVLTVGGINEIAPNARSAPSAVVSVSPVSLVAKPSAPTALAGVVASTGAVDLSWTDNGTAATSYLVQRCYRGAAAFTTIITLGAGSTAYADASAIGNVVYDYQIVATNAAGSAASAAASVSTVPPVPKPSAPTGLVGTWASGTGVSLSWTDNGAAATSYLVERRYQGTTAFTTIATLVAGFAAYTDASAFVNVIYEYQVIAQNSAGQAASAVATVSTEPPVVTPPEAPTGLTAYQPPNDSAVDLSWTDVGTSATSYIVERALVGFGGFTVLATLPAGSESCIDQSALPNASYDYQVIASNSAGTAASEVINFTTRSGPAMVTGVTAFLNSAGDVELDWTNDPSASTFDINRFQGGNLILLVVLPAGTTSYVDTTVSPNTTYTYDIISGSGNNYTGGLGVTITTTPTALPDPPTDFTTAPAAGGGLDLSWKDNGTNATSYLVQRRFQGATVFTTLATQSAGSTSYVDSSAQANVDYEYQIVASDAAGQTPSGLLMVNTATV